MEEEEIELWYEEQKHELSEKYIQSINRGVALEHREAKFNKAMDRLNRKYQALHTKHRKKLKRSKRLNALLKAILFPFTATGRGFAAIFLFIGGSIRNVSRAKCGQAYFKANIAWIRNGYKIREILFAFSRPFFFFYVKHLQVPLLAICKPFVILGRAFIKMLVGIGSSFARTAALGVFSQVNSSRPKCP